ncbi:MAG TPA: TauD/TfdA family dioxygenase [Dongiaceae bacterium]|jgi:taurine dioxygenase|nr:TauD/TfdA family dioxygenase [Dongiaceae bacterium]
MSASITPLSPIIGSKIRGIDLAEAVDDTLFSKIEDALNDTHLLVFRDQARLAPAQHIAFSRRFGPLQIHVQRKFHLPGHPEILVVSNEFHDDEPIGLVDAGKYWHSDLSYMAEPSLGSLLHAQVLPKDGGDTLFVNMHAAYDALDDGVKRRIATLNAEHSYLARNAYQSRLHPDRPQLDVGQAASVPPVVHPMVRIHPGNRQPALFVNEGFTTHVVGLPHEESDELLQFLFRHSVEPRFTYRHHWQAHDLVFWDNRSTMHLATGCPDDQPRTLYRTTVQGDRPRGLAA